MRLPTSPCRAQRHHLFAKYALYIKAFLYYHINTNWAVQHLKRQHHMTTGRQQDVSESNQNMEYFKD